MVTVWQCWSFRFSHNLWLCVDGFYGRICHTFIKKKEEKTPLWFRGVQAATSNGKVSTFIPPQRNEHAAVRRFPETVLSPRAAAVPICCFATTDRRSAWTFPRPKQHRPHASRVTGTEVSPPAKGFDGEEPEVILSKLIRQEQRLAACFLNAIWWMTAVPPVVAAQMEARP